MIKLFNKKIDVRFYFLALVLCFPFYKYNIISISIGLFGIVSLSSFIYFKEKFEKKNILYFLSSASFVLLMMVSLLYTDNLKEGLTRVQQSSSVLILSFFILFFIKKITVNQLNKLIAVFNTACLLFTVYVFFDIYRSGAYNFIFQEEVTFWNNPFRIVLKNLNVHPSYFSIWLLFCSIFLIDKLLKGVQSRLGNILIILQVVFFLFTSILFASRATLIGFFIAVSILVFLAIKSKIKRLVATASVILIIVISVTQISFLRVRFLDEINAQKLRPPVGIAHTSSNIRVGIYQCALEIFKENPIMGIGVGDVQAKLNNCYLQFHTRVYEEGNYNSHSTYLNLLLSGGVFALLLFLSSLFLQLKLALKFENYVYLSFIILIIPFFLFENVLSRMHGAVFYGLFNALFLKQILSTKK